VNQRERVLRVVKKWLNFREKLYKWK
jgi:hypothetical protein